MGNTDKHDSLIEELDVSQLDSVSRMAYTADRLLHIGFQSYAQKYAVEGYGRVISGADDCSPPQCLMDKYGAENPNMLFDRLCELTLHYSSYFAPDNYMRIFSEWRRHQPDNPEICLKLGLVLTLLAKSQRQPIPENAIELLAHANNSMKNERSAAAFDLAQGKMSEFVAIPYDQGRINLFADLRIITTYVLLEQDDWFEHDDLKLFRTMIRPSDNVIDIGANVGTFSVSAAVRATSGRVIAVEPVSRTHSLLARSADLYENMRTVHAALSSENGKSFISYETGPEMCQLKEQAGPNGETVELMSLDSLASQNDVDSFDLIKMDAEGHEVEILKGAKKIIQDQSPIIFYEYKAGTSINNELIIALSELGYDSYYYAGGNSTLYKYDKNIPVDGFLLNMVAVKPEALSRFENIANIDTAENHVELLKKLTAQ